jgi:hypothetical protein
VSIMDTLLVNSAGTIRHSIPKNLLRLALSFSLMLLAASHAAAQYGGGGGGTMGGGSGTPGYTAPKNGYGSGRAIGIGVGAAAGAGILFVALHNHGNVTGCIEPAEDGLRLVDAKKNKSYALLAGPVPLRPGQRVELKGQKSKSEDGTQSFEARKLVKDLGSCTAPPLAQPQPAGH